jgi:aerobic carbon-monoxide dehydrogenase medium subunit
MYSFNYHKPASVADAVALLGAHGDAKLMAGGQTFIPTLKQRLAQPSDVIDLGAIAELKGIKEEAGGVTIGAMTKHAEVASSELVRRLIPSLASLVETVGDPQVRNRGTIGGSISNNDPAADYPGALLALGATVRTNKREIAADDFFTGMFSTALEPGELLVAVEFPIPAKAGYAKMKNPASRYVMAGAFVAKTASGEVRVAINGAGPCVFRQAEMEKALSASWSPDAVAGVKQPADDLNSDIHGSAEYRAHLVTVMAKRAVADAG